MQQKFIDQSYFQSGEDDFGSWFMNVTIFISLGQEAYENNESWQMTS